MTSAFLATVGNDSLPVMTGLAWALQEGRSFQHVLLLEDNPDDRRWADQRQRLHVWIRRQVPAAQVGQVKVGQLRDTLDMLGVGHVTANVTGGRKDLALQAAQALEGGSWQADVFVVDAHTSSHALIRGRRQALEAARLNLVDVLAIYAPDAQLRPDAPLDSLLRAFQESLPVPAPVQVVDWQDNRYAAALIGSVLHVLWVSSSVHGGHHLITCADQHSLRSFRQRVLQLGGQLARAYVPDLRAFAPPGRLPSQLAALRARQEGLALTLNLTRVPAPAAPGAAAPAGPALPAPPPATPARHTLLSVLGEQPMPTLRDLERLRAGGALDRVELLVTDHPAVRATARRLAAWGTRHQVPVYAHPVEVGDPRSVIAAVQAALTAEHVTLNLTGGTKGMALAALEAVRAQPNVTLTITRGRQVHHLGGAPLPTPMLSTGLEDLLALHGVQPTVALDRPICRPELERAARQVLRDDRHEPQFTALRGAGLQAGSAGRGYALEYLAYLALKRAYPGADVALGAKIQPFAFQGDREEPVRGSSDQEPLYKEVDVLAAINGELVVVEAKWRLDRALADELEHLDSGQFGWDLGRFAHVAIVSVECREWLVNRRGGASIRDGWKQSYWLHHHASLSQEGKAWIRPFNPEAWAVLRDTADLPG